MTAQIPNNIRDPEVLAEDIYTTWRQLMITDKVIKPDSGWPVWMRLDDSWKRTLTESVRMCCTDDLNRVQEKIESEQLDFKFIDDRKPVKVYQKVCYVCEQQYETTVNERLPLCVSCGRKS